MGPGGTKGKSPAQELKLFSKLLSGSHKDTPEPLSMVYLSPALPAFLLRVTEAPLSCRTAFLTLCVVLYLPG